MAREPYLGAQAEQTNDLRLPAVDHRLRVTQAGKTTVYEYVACRRPEIIPTPAFGADLAVLTPDTIGHLIALPGVLRALRDTPAGGFGADLLYRLDVHRACARALAALTPIDRVLPDLADPDLTDAVARAAGAALHPPTFKESL